MSLGQFLSATAAFLVFDAKSMFNYGFVFFALVTITNSIVVYSIVVWKSQNTLKFIKNCEGFIKNSKYTV